MLHNGDVVVQENENSRLIQFFNQKFKDGTGSNIISDGNNFKQYHAISAESPNDLLPVAGSEYTFTLPTRGFVKDAFWSFEVEFSAPNVIQEKLGLRIFSESYLSSYGSQIMHTNFAHTNSRINELRETEQDTVNTLTNGSGPLIAGTRITFQVPIYMTFFEEGSSGLALDYFRSMTITGIFNPNTDMHDISFFKPTLNVHISYYDRDYQSDWILTNFPRGQSSSLLAYDVYQLVRPLNAADTQTSILLNTNDLIFNLFISIYESDFSQVDISRVRLYKQNVLIIDSSKEVNVLFQRGHQNGLPGTEFNYNFGTSQVRNMFSGGLSLTSGPYKLLIDHSATTSASLYINMENHLTLNVTESSRMVKDIIY